MVGSDGELVGDVAEDDAQAGRIETALVTALT